MHLLNRLCPILMCCLLGFSATHQAFAQSFAVGIIDQHKTMTIEPDKDGKYKIVGHNKKTILDRVDSIKWHNHTYLIVSKKGKMAMYNDAGECRIPLLYNRVQPLFNWFWLVEKNGKKGVYSSKGAILLPVQFDDVILPSLVSWIKGADFIVQNRQQYGIYDGEGKVVVPIEYDKIDLRQNIFILQKGDQKHYLISNRHLIKEYKVLLPPIRQSIDDYGGHLTYYIVEKEGKYGIIDQEAQVVIHPQYEEISDLSGLFGGKSPALKIKENGKYGIIGINRQVILPSTFISIATTNLPSLLTVQTDQGKQLFRIADRKIIKDYYFDELIVTDYVSTIRKDGVERKIDNWTGEIISSTPSQGGEK
ncbi:MAG: WG repeat-containing protein [Prevotella sp.]|nr:WG repeat-containing protein [Prevotellaceae bacterium]MDY3366416.1 WG repeat-containing protein [Prevotella sp.]MDY3853331.1 WG repeat-containing protein [Prevotella sp.]